MNAFSADDKTNTETATIIPPQSELVEPLSEHEIEVFSLIAEGLTNQEIADRLYISLNTVKVHTRNINGKLAVNSRAKAVTRVKTLGIIPPV